MRYGKLKWRRPRVSADAVPVGRSAVPDTCNAAPVLNPDDPLIQVPIDLESYVADAMARGSSSDVVSLMAEYFREVVVRMSGFDTVGTPLVPPDEHVLDHLARAWDLVDAETAAHRPSAGTVACPVDALECDICGESARYETYVSSRGDRVQVYACLECTRQHGDPILGAGASVYLMDFDEVSSAVREVCDEIRRRQGIGSIWGDDLGDVEPEVGVAEDLGGARLQTLLELVCDEAKALRSDADRAFASFNKDDKGFYDVSRREWDAYQSLVGRYKRLEAAMETGATAIDGQAGCLRDGNTQPTADSPLTSSTATSATPVPDAMAISARLRRLWIGTVGPLIDEDGHDLAEVWTNALVQRVGSQLIVSGPIDFGDGDPFEGALGSKIKKRFEDESCGLVRDVQYKFADRRILKLRRASTAGSDIYHPEDAGAPDIVDAARAIGSQLADAGPGARHVLGRLTVAGVSKFRLWLAAPSEAERKAVGSTPGAASALMMAVAKFQRSDALCDIVVDPDAWERYPRLNLS